MTSQPAVVDLASSSLGEKFREKYAIIPNWNLNTVSLMPSDG